MPKLNLGGENLIMPRFVNLAKSKKEGVEKIHNLDNFPWPFPDNAFDEIQAENILERQSNLVAAMEEIWRISKPKAKISIIVPWYNSSANSSQPYNKFSFNFATFDYFTREAGKTDKNFKIIKIKSMPCPWGRLIPNIPLKFIRKGTRLGLRDFLASFVGEMNYHLYIKLEVEKNE